MSIDIDTQPPKPEFADLRRGMSDTVFWGFFIVLVCDAVILRGLETPCLSGAGGATFAEQLDQYLFSRGAGRPNFRVLGPLLLAAIEAAIHGLNDLAFVDSTNSTLYRGTPWPITDWVDQRAAGCGPRLIALFAFIGLTTLPVAIAVRLWVRAWWLRLLLLGLIIWPVIGWHPLIVNLAFMTGDLFADWPKSYYLFNQWLAPTDFLVVGVVFSTLLFASRWRDPKPTCIVGGAIATQFTFEYLGLMFAMALFTGTMFSHLQSPWRARLRLASIRFSMAFGAAVAAAVAGLILFYGMGGFVGEMGDFSEGLPINIVNNMNWFRSTIANLISMATPAVIVGLMIGGLSVYTDARTANLDASRRDFAVAATLALGFVVVFVVGFATAAYPGEMGRQFMPFAALLVGVGFTTVRFVFASRH